MAILDEVEALSVRMWNTPPLDQAEVRILQRKHMDAIQANLLQGKSYGGASGGALSFLSRPDATEHLRAIEHDLSAQVAIVSRSFDDYLAKGEIPAPHYPMRIAILLSKAGHKRHEIGFLAAWCKHFATARNAGGNYGKLTKRALKLGALSIAPRPSSTHRG